MDVDYIAYEGACYTIEWYVDTKQKSPALDYYQQLNEKERIRCLRLFKLMGDQGQIHDKTKFRHEGNKLYAFKPKPNRFLCFFYEGKKIIVTNAFLKQRQNFPIKEKEKAARYRKDYMNRMKQGEYYE